MKHVGSKPEKTKAINLNKLSSKFVVISQKMSFQKDFVWAQYQFFPIRCQQNSAGAHSGWICDLQ